MAVFPDLVEPAADYRHLPLCHGEPEEIRRRHKALSSLWGQVAPGDGRGTQGELDPAGGRPRPQLT